ncbi:class I SAM-dependent methyltransferase [Marinigracilibium pacificum]|uniref:Class I SAM-dependent methyltransferase n=1 Tax=Marinigracilibium pacificum TaxID=2729599 RepID=A0A848IWB4_9BACT|nr:class I SAM-dependent methyltransferase [Marinigracilibium pacificum]NMM48803.1 class I SAM-dependent methyltransferase [Marinigracilibium pacificum]
MRKTLNKSDLDRWRKRSSFDENWDSRTIKMASYVQPNSSVIEFGAGRLVLKDHLPANCNYTPSDIVERGHNTLVIDLNKYPLPDLDNFDYAIFSGVLEYVNKLPKFVDFLSPRMKTIVASYATLEKNKLRGIHGWVNSYTEQQFVEIFENSGYVMSEKAFWKNQTIYVFENKKS